MFPCGEHTGKVMEVYAEPTDLVHFEVRSPGYSGSAKSAIGPWEDNCILLYLQYQC